jgi:hypothetical protein
MDTASPSPPPRKPPRTPEERRYIVFVALGLAVAAGLMALAIARTNTDDPTVKAINSRPDIEQLIPRKGAETQRQSELGIDLAPGYEAALIVDGTPIPEAQLRRVPAQNEVFFTPGEGKVIEELDAGQVCVTAVIWKSAVGRGVSDQPFQWCFDTT